MRSKIQLLAWVEKQVRACRPIALRYFRSRSLRIYTKADQSPVTMADRLIEERLRKAIGKTFPGESILGEEFGQSGLSKNTFWTIDPIDGTRAFSKGLPSWGIMIGRVERGKATLGVVDLPALGITLVGCKGVRAYERIGRREVLFPKAKPARSLSEAVVFHGGARWWNSPRYLRGFQRLLQECYLERAYGDCYGYLWVLRGKADAMIDYGVKPWDLVPFAAMVKSTGHLLSDFAAHPSFTGPGTVMAHPKLARVICNFLTPRKGRRKK